jgi:hypothetical protein
MNAEGDHILRVGAREDAFAHASACAELGVDGPSIEIARRDLRDASDVLREAALTRRGLEVAYCTAHEKAEEADRDFHLAGVEVCVERAAALAEERIDLAERLGRADMLYTQIARLAAQLAAAAGLPGEPILGAGGEHSDLTRAIDVALHPEPVAITLADLMPEAPKKEKTA